MPLLKPTKPRADRAVRALALLHRVCERMDLSNQMQRPTESTYQRAMRAAKQVLEEPTPATEDWTLQTR